MNKDILGPLFAVILCSAAGTLLIFQPVWFWRGIYRDNGSNSENSRKRQDDLRLLRENRKEFTRRFFGSVLFWRFLGVLWYIGALVFLVSLVTNLFPD